MPLRGRALEAVTVSKTPRAMGWKTSDAGNAVQLKTDVRTHYMANKTPTTTYMDGERAVLLFEYVVYTHVMQSIQMLFGQNNYVLIDL